MKFTWPFRSPYIVERSVSYVKRVYEDTTWYDILNFGVQIGTAAYLTSVYTTLLFAKAKEYQDNRPDYEIQARKGVLNLPDWETEAQKLFSGLPDSLKSWGNPAGYWHVLGDLQDTLRVFSQLPDSNQYTHYGTAVAGAACFATAFLSTGQINPKNKNIVFCVFVYLVGLVELWLYFSSGIGEKELIMDDTIILKIMVLGLFSITLNDTMVCYLGHDHAFVDVGYIHILKVQQAEMNAASRGPANGYSDLPQTSKRRD